MLQIFAVAFFVLAGILAMPNGTSAAPAMGSLFKAPEHSAVYTMGGDGKRHVFPIEAVYKSWYGDNWSLHRTIPLYEVSNLMLGRNIVYKPGTLVKIPSVSKVYYVKEVSNDHDLAYIEWVPTESEFYARGFRIRDIKDLPEPFFPGHYVELPNNNPIVNAQAAEDGNDFDHDTIPDVIDNCPINANTNQADADSDRVGDVCDSYDNRQISNTPNNDYDSDGIYDSIDNCPTVYNRDQTDIDSDRVGDACDYYNNRQQAVNNDFDGDTIPDTIDNCPLNANTNQADADSDRVGDVCDSYNNRQQATNNDFDSDTIPDAIDNCPVVANQNQADADSDRVGDVCDGYDNRTQVPSNDFDHDGIPDSIDNCPLLANQNQADADSDRVGDVCDSYDNRQTPIVPNNDFDSDTIPDAIDNCPINANTSQADADSDRVGDVCDSYDNRQTPVEPNIDFDNDTIPDSIDNCPINANTNQSDVDSDRVGDVCDSYDNRQITPPPADTDHDTIPDTTDNCPTVPNTNQSDVDGDRIGDACDNRDDRIQPLVPPALYLDPVSCEAPAIKIWASVTSYQAKLKFVYGSAVTQTLESPMGYNPSITIDNLILLTHYRGALTVTNQEGAFYTTGSVVFKLYKDSATCKIVFFEGGTGWNTHEISVKPDADGDKLCDADEVKYKTNPNVKDTDADGLSDYEEALVYYSDPLKIDTDGDGLSDKDEILNKTYPRISDSDYDGVGDYKEVVTYRTNPLSKDTDKDGVYDATEIQNGTDPLSSASK